MKKEEYAKSRQLSDVLLLLLNMSLDAGKLQSIDQVKSFASLAGKNIGVREAIGVRLIQRALHGDLKAIEMIRDTIGERPPENVNMCDITPIIVGEDNLAD